MKKYRFNIYKKNGGGDTFIYEQYRGMMSAKEYARLLLADGLLNVKTVTYEKI